MRIALLAAVVAIVVSAACTDPPVDDERPDRSPPTVFVPPPGSWPPLPPPPPMPPPVGCQDWGCTGNSPTMGPFDFHEMKLQVANREGLKLLGLWKAGIQYHPVVDGDTLVGLPPGNVPPVKLEGAGLVDAFFRIENADHEVYRMYIVSVGSIPSWTDAGPAVETYELRYMDPGGAPYSFVNSHPVCANPPTLPDLSDDPIEPWTDAIRAVLFTGDRYDAKTKHLQPTTISTAGWINIGCAGSALAKMHLFGFTTASSYPGHVATWDERNDLLAMFTGNVCGDGVSYTEPGTPIRWASRNGWHALDYPDAPTKLEGVWARGRAQCLDDFRLPAKRSLITCLDQLDGDGDASHDGCSDLTASWTRYGSVQTGIP